MITSVLLYLTYHIKIQNQISTTSKRMISVILFSRISIRAAVGSGGCHTFKDRNIILNVIFLFRFQKARSIDESFMDINDMDKFICLKTEDNIQPSLGKTIHVL